jgi:hypothetical protein
MDSSRSGQSEALQYLLYGIGPGDITDPAERLVAIKAKLKVFESWGPRRPGFRPLGLLANGEGVQAKYPRRINGKTKIMLLAVLGGHRDLLVTLEGELLTVSRKRTGVSSSVAQVEQCSDSVAERFFGDISVVVHVCEAINRAIEDRVRELHQELRTATEVQRRMGKTILPRTL